MNHQEKLSRYHNGHYRFKAPPVCTAFWSDDDWIAWIDACGSWDLFSQTIESCGWLWVHNGQFSNNAALYSLKENINDSIQ